MGLRPILKGAIFAGAMTVFGASAAMAQNATCEETQFSSKTGEVYLKAETELLQNDNPQAALQHINKLRSMELNCYEQGAVLKLGAAIKIQANDYAGAARDLQAAIDQGYVPEAEKAKT